MKFIRQFWTRAASNPVSVIGYSINAERREIIFQSDKSELPLSFDEASDLVDQIKGISEIAVKGFVIPAGMLRSASVDMLMEMSNPPKPKNESMKFWSAEQHLV